MEGTGLMGKLGKYFRLIYYFLGCIDELEVKL